MVVVAGPMRLAVGRTAWRRETVGSGAARVVARAAPQGAQLRSASAQALLRCSTQGRKNARSVSVVKAISAPSKPAQGSPSAGGPTGSPSVLRFYRRPGLTEAKRLALLNKSRQSISNAISDIHTEMARPQPRLCYNIEISAPLNSTEKDVLMWLLRETYEPELTAERSGLDGATIVEVGPRMNFSTAYSANAVSIFQACGLTKVTRCEVSRRYEITAQPGKTLTPDQVHAFAASVHDRMTECVYAEPLRSFKVDKAPQPVYTIPVMEQGMAALEAINKEMGLAFDDQDFAYYLKLFRDDLKRNPTNVELFDIAQSNSEHSRHWFFNGKMTVDGKEMATTLFKMVKETLKAHPDNSVIGFKDNSSAIRGAVVKALFPDSPGSPSPLRAVEKDLDLLFTAETHNFPCAVAPYPGAETGAGGRIRDTHATGRGSLVQAATAGYCVGNLRIEGHVQEHEDPSFQYSPNLAPPLQILIDASNGASDYGNKFGEPLIQGFCRSFGQRLLNGERREWLKPIMFSGGFGQIDHTHLEKDHADVGMLVVKLGGPAYRIGLGGGAASSMTSGSNDADLDFNAVQRGDAQMAQKLNRVVRTCVELGARNPILSIHDQGAGGNCNVVKEIIYPGGAEIDIRKVIVGDETMSVMDIWGAEYQENDALLIKPEDELLLRSIAERERCPMSVIGTISGSGRVVLVDKWATPGTPTPEDLELEKVLGDLPQKVYDLKRVPPKLAPLKLPQNVTPEAALARVLRLVSVGSKRFLTNKVDRSVTGLVARQQCVGPLQLPVADVAVIAQSYFGTTGGACAVGEQPIKGLLDPRAMARLALGEALTNLVWAEITKLSDVKSSGNWMYAAKLDGDGAHLWDACESMRDAMIRLGVAIDGGKDSLSMAAKAGGETVKAPGELVISLYAPCPDVTKTVTPDLKTRDGRLILVDIAAGKRRLGGSALCQAFAQLGDQCPDMDDLDLFKRAFDTTQQLVRERLISAGHDVSDGGLVTAVLEMAFAGNTGVEVNLPPCEASGAFGALFAEELGLVLEVAADKEQEVLARYAKASVPALAIGRVKADSSVRVSVGGQKAVEGTVAALRDAWEETSFELERLQSSPVTVAAEQASLSSRTAPEWKLPFTPAHVPPPSQRAKVAILREEGSNGDREMSAAVYMAGMEPWDVTVSDLLNGRVSLDHFRGIVFVGGFSYADVLDSAKGWAACIKFNSAVWQQFQAFYKRPDTFSLGICNGCQLMALLGWVPGTNGADQPLLPAERQPRFVHNLSGRFESRFVTVKVLPGSPSVLLKGMEGLQIGVWSAHGEGHAMFPDEAVKKQVLAGNMAPVRYVDDQGNETEAYPFNPNGSPLGIAGLCSPCGRHLAMMPHPERSVLMWQFPWVGASAQGLPKDGPSPWLKMFQNAAAFLASAK